MGGTETDPGIFINWALRLGTTASRCITFNKFWPISRDLVFDIRILELWVVNEVFKKKRNVPKRDFYSTVVMWNRIGKHKAKEDHSRTDYCRDCYNNGINALANVVCKCVKNCSHVEIHETEERHFEPSETSLAGTNNADDELLIAIKNRLAGVPPMPGGLSLKTGAGLRRINQDLPTVSTKQQYPASNQSDKPKKVPTQASTQVDDSMITELKNQSTSTSRVKATSRFTQSGIGLASQTDETVQTQPSTSRNQQEVYQRLPLQNMPLYQHQSRILRSDEQYQQPLQPRRNSFPNHLKPTSPLLAQANYDDQRSLDVIRNSIHSDRNSINSDRNSLTLPGVPDYIEASPQRPSVSRSIRGSTDESPYNQQIRELSWSNRRNMRAILPYQQQLVRAAHDYEDPNQKRPSQSSMLLGPREVNREPSQNGNQPHQNLPPPSKSTREVDFYGSPNQQSPSRSARDDPYPEPSQYQNRQSPSQGVDGDQSQNQYRHPPSPNRTMREDAYQEISEYQNRPSPSQSGRQGVDGDRSQNQYHPSPNRSLRDDPYQEPSQYQNRPSPSQSLRQGDSYAPNNLHQDGPSREGSPKGHSPPRVRIEPDIADSRDGTHRSPSPQQTLLTMTALESGQLCKCGSKELTLVCGCKKPILKEVEVIKTDQYLRECRCPSIYGSDTDDSKKKKKKKQKKEKKEKKSKPDKEAKAEEKRRKKEEKEREKREKKEQKAREKESRKSKSKREKKSKNKKECRMCTCCKCEGGGDEGEIHSETSQSEDTSKKKSKKEKKVKEKKTKEKKQKVKKAKDKKKRPKEADDQTFRACECPASIQIEEISQSRQAQQVQQQSIQVERETVEVQQQTLKASSVIGYCNHPDMPCPVLGNTSSQLRVQSRKSIMLQPSSENYCRDPACTNRNRRVNRNWSDGSRDQGGYNVDVNTYPAMVDRNSTGFRSNSRSPQRYTNRKSPSSSGSVRYRDITAAPALIYPNESGHGDSAHLGRWPTDPQSTSLPSALPTNGNLLLDLSNTGRGKSPNKRYVPPCVLYLDCTKVKDLCVIIKDKYEEDPS